VDGELHLFLATNPNIRENPGAPSEAVAIQLVKIQPIQLSFQMEVQIAA